jgi:hypothetical protein
MEKRAATVLPTVTGFATSLAAQAKFLENDARAMDDSAFALHLAVKPNPRERGLLFYVASAARAGPIRRDISVALRIRMNLGHATIGASAAPVVASGGTELLRWPLSMKK